MKTSWESRHCSRYIEEQKKKKVNFIPRFSDGRFMSYDDFLAGQLIREHTEIIKKSRSKKEKEDK